LGEGPSHSHWILLSPEIPAEPTVRGPTRRSKCLWASGIDVFPRAVRKQRIYRGGGKRHLRGDVRAERSRGWIHKEELLGSKQLVNCRLSNQTQGYLGYRLSVCEGVIRGIENKRPPSLVSQQHLRRDPRRLLPLQSPPPHHGILVPTKGTDCVDSILKRRRCGYAAAGAGAAASSTLGASAGAAGASGTLVSADQGHFDLAQ
jgi:hypothetical protein